MNVFNRHTIKAAVVGVGGACGGGCKNKNSKSKVTKVASPFESSRKASKCKGAKAKDAGQG